MMQQRSVQGDLKHALLSLIRVNETATEFFHLFREYAQERCVNMLRRANAAMSACVCVCKACPCRQIQHGVDITGMMIKMDFLLPNLVKATGVETLLRFPSSARFDELPVQGKSFPLRNTINCSLQVELSTDCNGEEEIGVPASGKWIEATATEFCGWNKKEREREENKN